MAQKDKIKELVGRGLNSYHTKALQQMDRIEKKNKEQNHKISILSNELDNDYLTKTEEGSVISLEHSKEGMVYLDELQGNTLVNYCTDGSKEMTLNGDIDVEGISVTTTEGVDNGKVDVMCEGNTLVNAWTLIDENSYNPNISSNLTSKVTVDKNKTSCKITINENLSLVDGNKWIVFRAYPKQHCRDMIKLNTTYTLIFNLDYNFDLNLNIGVSIADNIHNHFARNKSFMPKKGLNKVVITTVSEEPENRRGQHIYIGFPNFLATDMIGKYFKFSDFYMLEGDWTNKETPSYFEEMKSVGQDDENGHKIEILSRNKNLFNINDFEFNSVCGGVDLRIEGQEIVLNGTSTSSYTRHSFVNYLDYMKDKTTYTLSGDYMLMETTYNDGRQTWTKQITTDKSNMKKVTIYLQWLQPNTVFDNLRIRPMLEEGSVATTYVTPSLNKKEILINEPLRGLPNGVKDQIVKIGGKYFIERKCGEFVLTDSLNYSLGNTNGVPYIQFPFKLGASTDYTTENKIICNRVNTTNVYTSNTNIGVCYVKSDNIRFRLTDSDTLDSFTTWLNQGLTVIVYELVNPIYEPLEIEPTLNTYNDVTHISNDSIIPCTMKIKNTGYNAIIKPSTLYTVALDANKNGTIEMNLGGAKVTTTNNVATITTPATLTDDSLRLYGKGIKGSKVRLLEGDKTNWIPSHFEGMKSSFEDKFDATDNTYKMEILMKNKNLLDLTDIVHKAIGEGCRLDACSTELIQYTSNQEEWTNIFFMMKLKPFTRYTLSVELQSMNVYVFNDRVGNWNPDKYMAAIQNTTNTLQKKQVSFTTNKTGCISIRFTNEMMLGVNIAKNIILSEVAGDYTSKKSNKIQFLLDEPLRRYKNSTDKFVFKDNKLMIERNCAIKIFNGSENWNYSSWINNNGKINRFSLDTNLPSYSYQISNKYKYIWGDYPDTYYRTDNGTLFVYTQTNKTLDEFKQELKENNLILLGETTEPIYEEIPFELQKIILEGYENGTLFFDTNIPPTSTVTYAGETPIVKATKLNKTEVLNNTNDINDNIIPYLMDMDYRVVCLQLATEEIEGGVSVARLFGGAYEMLKRDILSKRLTREEYGHRLADYFNAGKLTEEQVRELEDLR